MPSFMGFPSGKVHMTPVPAPFFSELLPEIDHLGELKVTLYAIWYLNRQEGPVRFIRYPDFCDDPRFLKGLAKTEENALTALAEALERAVIRNTLLRAIPAGSGPQEAIYFLNSPRGRAALAAYQAGEWQPDGSVHANLSLELERPNIYRLYEENIGPLTAMIADMLREAEKNHSLYQIEEAIRIAVQNNARSWRYVEKVLDRMERGRDETNRRDSEKNSSRYLDGEFGDFIEH